MPPARLERGRTRVGCRCCRLNSRYLWDLKSLSPLYPWIAPLAQVVETPRSFCVQLSSNEADCGELIVFVFPTPSSHQSGAADSGLDGANKGSAASPFVSLVGLLGACGFLASEIRI